MQNINNTSNSYQKIEHIKTSLSPMNRYSIPNSYSVLCCFAIKLELFYFPGLYSLLSLLCLERKVGSRIISSMYEEYLCIAQWRSAFTFTEKEQNQENN